WLGTYEGLVRFDGVDFTVFDLGNTKEFTSNYVRALIEDAQGNLWIGIDGGGLVRYKDSRFHRYSKEEGLEGANVMALYEDSDGKIWIGSIGGGLSVFSDGRFTNYSTTDGLPSNNVQKIAAGESGEIWVATDKGLASFRDGKITAFEGNDRLTHTNIISLYRGIENKLWVGSENGLNLVENGELVEFNARKQFGGAVIRAISEDRNGRLLVGTNISGLHRLDQNAPHKAESLTTPESGINSIYKDSEDQVWVGTYTSGLLRFTDKDINPLSSPDFQLEEHADGVFEDQEGGLWFSISVIAYRLKDGIIKGPITSLPVSVRHIAQDREGNIWFASDDVYKLSKGKITTFSTDEGLSPNRVRVFSLLGDSHSGIWAGTFDGLHLIRDGQVRIFRKEDGLVNNDTRSLLKDRVGSIWIGTADGLSRYRDGRFTNWTTKDGLAPGRINAMHEDKSGTIWISSQSGLSRFKDGQFSIITTRDGLYDNLAYAILEDDAGNLWMSSNRGIYRTSLKELNDFADGITDSVQSFSYGKEDGMPSREGSDGSAGIKTRDGRLWFTTVKGLVEVDPKPSNSEPPRVFIEKFLINEKSRPANKGLLEIQSGEESLEIKYTAISWKRPSQIKFKYRLEGLDQDWIDVGTRRTAYFSYLPPGEYTFRVIADNGEGVWNNEGQSLKIVVLPPFYRTSWFTVLVIAVFSGIIFALVRRRIATLKRERSAQQAFARQLIASQEQERKRIAAELHDSLGQRLVVIKNLALMFLNARNDDAENDQSIEYISTEASQAIGEVKEISYNLRPYQLDRIGLTKAIEAIIRASQSASAIEFASEIDDIDGYFPKDAEINFYRIVQECVNNLVKHSEATTASVKIRRSGTYLDLEIGDNGKGFTPGQTESKTGGFGLTGIVERAEIFGGNVEIRSAPQQGTTIKIRLNSRNFLRDNKNVSIKL
ncbi:MAG TPA: two-component regulator propeller domain-containing protein, partial [Pyrinomonadaceae bacterium]|nr:two-component regulator propeller domain-containing protein [Pyrinomonadaceae bacterium]